MEVHPLLTVIALIPMPAILAYSFVFHRHIHDGFMDCDENEGKLSAMAQENLTGVRVVRAFGRERAEIDKFKKQNDYYTSLWEKMAKIMSKFWSLSDILAGVQGMLVVVFGEDNPVAIDDVMGAVKERFPMITSLMYVINLKVNDTIGDQEVITYSGRDYIEEEMEGLRFRIGPKSFYQTNSLQAYELYKVARNFACLTGDELVYDLYTGTGTIANFVARQCRKVVGIEYVPEAIEDAKLNSQVNGIDNTLFYAGDMKDVLTDDFVREHGVPDVMIVDPPRAGMHDDVVKVILNASPRRIVYVSCNPATQARDLQLLDAKYRVTAIQPVDMFPHTHHVENVVSLELRDN